MNLPGWPSFSETEADKVRDVLLSNRVNFWTGDECKSFEKEFAEFADAKHAVAVTNGTAALEASFRAIGLGPGDEVILTSRSFFASASAVVFCGATPVFADVDRDSQNVQPEAIKQAITKNTKAILAVHLAGWPCEMAAITELAEQHGLFVVEDCAQAHGAKYRGRSVGSLGHIAAWSFCQDKIMTTGGEGGMVTTNDHALWEAVWAYKDHGKSHELATKRTHPPGFRWLHTSFGTNVRMTEMQAAIGRIQLQRMGTWWERRARNAQHLSECFEKYPFLRLPDVPDHVQHAFYKYYVFVEPNELPTGWSRDRIIEQVTAKGVPCFSGSCSEMYLEEACEHRGLAPAQPLPVARELGDTSLMFLVHPTLDDSHMHQIVAVLDSVLADVRTEC